MNKVSIAILMIVGITVFSYSQVPLNTLVQISKAEDARAFDAIEALLRSPNAAVRERAAIAAGRIGDKRAVPVLAKMVMEPSNQGKVVVAAIFALGEIEAPEGGEMILDILKAESGAAERDVNVLSRAVEAAGKIVAANAKNESLKDLKAAIVRVIEDELKSAAPMGKVLMAGATAVLRTRPDGGDAAVAKMLDSSDAGVRADALNALTRLRSKQRLGDIRGLLRRDPDAVVRANAARALGAAEDKEALPLLIDYAINGDDLRVRVSCIRSLSALKDTSVVGKLIERGNQLLISIHGDPAPLKPGEKRELKPIEVPMPKNELLEIATTIGQLCAGKADQEAIKFLKRLSTADKYSSTETESAIARIAPDAFAGWTKEKSTEWKNTPAAVSAAASALAVIGRLEENDANKALRAATAEELRKFLKDGSANGLLPVMALPDVLGAFAAFKTADLAEVARQHLLHKDAFVRAATAAIIEDLPASKENVDALKAAFINASLIDKRDNDALIATLDALAKLDKKAGVGTFLMALNDHDYLVRKKAFGILDDKELQKEFPGIPTSLAAAREKKRDQVLPYSPVSATKLGQILNTDADYRRALSRKNGSIKAVLTTEKGAFMIVFDPEEAPLTVDNWVKLARSGYFNGLTVHRVVPNFVMQDGDPRGDGNGGPGWSIRCEVNMLPYDRGAVGMALSGKDTGGSQWFVTHSPQPHLDGGYTVFGRVNDNDMRVVDRIARGDKILKVTVVGK